MIPYILFIILVLYFYWNRQPKLILLLMMLFAALRYDVGWDYGNYYAMCSDYDLLEYVKEKYSVVWGAYFSAAYNLNVPHLGVVIPSIITYFLIYKAADLFFDGGRKAVSFALLLFVLWPDFYLTSLSTIRQHLAVSIALFSGVLFIKGRPLPAFLVAGFNYLIHPSSIVMAVIFLLLLLKNRMTLVKTMILSILVVVSLIMIEDIISLINISEIQEYGDKYLEWEDNFGGKYKYVLAFVLILLFAIYPRIKSDQVILSKTASVSILGIVFLLVVYASGASSVLGRVSSYFTVYLLLSLFPQLNQLKNPPLWRNLVIIFCVALFFMQLMVTAGAVQLDSTSSYLPYRTIFSSQPDFYF